MQKMADYVGEMLPKDMGFAILVFPFNSGTSNYISNAQRPDMIKALRETANRLEKDQIFPTNKDNIYKSDT